MLVNLGSNMRNGRIFYIYLKFVTNTVVKHYLYRHSSIFKVLCCTKPGPFQTIIFIIMAFRKASHYFRWHDKHKIPWKFLPSVKILYYQKRSKVTTCIIDNVVRHCPSNTCKIKNSGVKNIVIITFNYSILTINTFHFKQIWLLIPIITLKITQFFLRSWLQKCSS